MSRLSYPSVEEVGAWAVHAKYKALQQRFAKLGHTEVCKGFLFEEVCIRKSAKNTSDTREFCQIACSHGYSRRNTKYSGLNYVAKSNHKGGDSNKQLRLIDYGNC